MQTYMNMVICRVHLQQDANFRELLMLRVNPIHAIREIAYQLSTRISSAKLLTIIDMSFLKTDVS